jgi:hypothetical protein
MTPPQRGLAIRVSLEGRRRSTDSFGDITTHDDANMTMDPTPLSHTEAASLRRHAQKATFGPLSLLVFGGAVLLLILIVLASHSFPLGYPGGLIYVFFAVIIGGGASILSAVLGIVGLKRHEHPRWPAVMALALSFLPVLGSMLLLLLMLWNALVAHTVK